MKNLAGEHTNAGHTAKVFLTSRNAIQYEATLPGSITSRSCFGELRSVSSN